ncbi:MAG: MFS transporter [Chloroflexota bacterium]
MSRHFEAFQSRTFRMVWCSSLATAGAQWMERVATGWLALETGGSALGVGAVLAARMLPSLLLGLTTGAIADRLDRRRMLMGVAAGGSLLTLALGLIVRSGTLAFWEVVVFAFLSGCVQVSDTPARQALVVDAVKRSGAPNALALNAVASRLFSAAGALLGGLVIPTFGVADCYFVVALCYLGGLSVLARLGSAPVLDRSPVKHPPLTQSIGEAGRLIRELPVVRTLVLAAMACEIFGFSYMTVIPTFARDVLSVGAEGYGALTAAAAFGATIVVLALAGLPAATRREPLLATVYLIYGAALVGLALSPTFGAALVAMALIGGCASAFDLLQQTLVQLAVPDDKRGRAAGIWAFSIGTAPIGHLEVGGLATSFGAPTALLANGSLVIVGALTLLSRAPTFRFRRARVGPGLE